MDLIREILLQVEALPPGKLLRDFSGFKEDFPTVAEHAWLAERDGLIEAQFSRPMDGSLLPMISRLTPKGHDFIEQARHQPLWNQAKEVALSKGVGLTVDIVSKLLQSLALKALGL